MAENNFKVSVKDVADIYCAAVCGLDAENGAYPPTQNA